jgi:uncharacterized protein (TIGR02145 family)
MKRFLSFIFSITVYFVSHAQSKKEQIVILQNNIDSLTNVLRSERITNGSKLIDLNSKISVLEEQISILNSNVNNLTEQLSSIQSESLQKQNEITELLSTIQSKSDSLKMLNTELAQFKPASKVTTTDNSAYKVSETVNLKTVKIGSQTWTNENLNVSTFRNGDVIPEAKTDEEWRAAFINKQPAWCYYENDVKNGNKYGKLYNWHAVNDPRGLAPDGFHIPTDEEWNLLFDYLGGFRVAGGKMKTSSGWESFTEELTCTNCEIASEEYKKICSVCKGTGKKGTKSYSGNGTNSSGFLGLPGGYRICNQYRVLFDNIGFKGTWWGIPNAQYVSNNLDGAYDFSGNLEYGHSVRCIKD